MVAFINRLGYTNIEILADSEHSLVDVAKAVKARRHNNTVVITTPIASKGSLGLVEGKHFLVMGQVRVMLSVLKKDYPNVEFTPQHKLMPWLVRQAGILLNVLHRGHDGLSSSGRHGVFVGVL